MVKKNETDKAYEVLKSRIIKLEYEPGFVLNEVEIAEEFNISRTPIREAFQKLHSDKLLNIIPRFGAQVSHVDFRYMKSVFEVTRELEPLAVKLTLEYLNEDDIKDLENVLDRLNSYDVKKDYKKAIIDDEAFHEIILNKCNNPCLKNILYDLHMHTERLWHYSGQYIDDIGIFTHTLGDVLEGIKEKDLEKIEKYSREHIDAFVKKIKKEML